LSFLRSSAHLRVHPSWLRAVVPAAMLLVACAGAPASDLFAEREPGRGAGGGEGSVDASVSEGDGAAMGHADANEPLGDARTELGDASGTVADASFPVGLDASGGPLGDAGAAAQDAALSPTYTADACLATPRAYTVSCDLACQPYNCRLIDCPTVPVSTVGLNEQTMGPLPWRLRTAPSTPETACTTRCGSATVAKGVYRFELDFAATTNLTLKVGAPWRIVVNPRYALCVSQAEAASSTARCVSREFTKATITVFTTEPAAPPKDIVIDRFPRAYCTEEP
jgi:hypothetical protein